VWLHETIDTSKYSKAEVPELRDRVWREVAGPIHDSMGKAAAGSGLGEEAKA
jgi:hypothetical protein